MKTKAPVSIKKQSVTVKDLKTRKNPKGGAQTVSASNHKRPPPIVVGPFGPAGGPTT